MSERLTEELLGTIEQKIFKMRVGEAVATCFHPDLVESLITALRTERARVDHYIELGQQADLNHDETLSKLEAEREAHQETRAELEAAREVIETTDAARWHTCPLCNCTPRVPCGDYYRLLVRQREARETYDAVVAKSGG